ncbi:helix-turn-helix domain-containing protein [Thiohalorhabdus sp. Cl-TMA]|uniref:Helix-turn-helix domain-containing protein n=1 Tax=Thiohalorhabdus methylotrophus TaxID=3242694 RepID=A0ABV4TXA1_9GAMM
MGKKLLEMKEEFLQGQEFSEHYHDLAPEYALARELIAARQRAALTQSEVAERMHTNQPAVARLESGRQMPTWKTLRRYAEATGTHFEVRLVPSDERAQGAERPQPESP